MQAADKSVLAIAEAPANSADELLTKVQIVLAQEPQSEPVESTFLTNR